MLRIILVLGLLSTSAFAQQPNWKRIEADNGAVFAIDLSSIVRAGGLADAMVCPIDNNHCAPWNVTSFRFDCHGHFMDFQTGRLELAPPRSVVGHMAAIACGTAKE